MVYCASKGVNNLNSVECWVVLAGLILFWFSFSLTKFGPYFEYLCLSFGVVFSIV